MIKFLHSFSPAAHAAALVWILCLTSVMAAVISRRVMTLSLLVRDSWDASELTSLSRTGLGKLCRLARKSGLLIAAGPTCRRDERLTLFFLWLKSKTLWPALSTQRDVWQRNHPMKNKKFKSILNTTCPHKITVVFTSLWALYMRVGWVRILFLVWEEILRVARTGAFIFAF